MMSQISRWMQRNYFVSVSAILIVWMAWAVACTEVNVPGPTSPGGGGTTVVVNTNVGGGTTPTPGTGSTSPIYKVKVGFFGGSCPGAVPLPAGSIELEVGCEGSMTATPKVQIDGGGDRDATQNEHGPDSLVEWTSNNDNVLKCVTSPANGFNRVCAAKNPGTWTQCAIVKGVKGCAEGTVVP